MCGRLDRPPYHPRMDASADFIESVTQAAEDAVNFDGDAVAFASSARGGDKEAVADLVRAYAAIAVLTGVRLRPPWLPTPDAGQEAMLVLLRLIEWFDNDRCGLAVGYRGDIHGVEATRRFEGVVMYAAVA
jgi:hypothetical protein